MTVYRNPRVGHPRWPGKTETVIPDQERTDEDYGKIGVGNIVRHLDDYIERTGIFGTRNRPFRTKREVRPAGPVPKPNHYTADQLREYLFEMSGEQQPVQHEMQPYLLAMAA